MAVMDEFREEREALKNGTPKEKLSYFWDYYKWHVIIGIVVIAFITSLIYEITTQKEDAFFGAFINSWELEGAPDYLQGFADTIGIDTEEYDIIADSSLYISTSSMDETTMTASERLAVLVAAQELDVMISDAATMEQYTNTETFFDLREILSPEQLEKYEPYFYYVDQKIVDEKAATNYLADESYVPDYPDPTKPEEMTEPIPVGIYIDSCEGFKNAYVFSKEPLVLGVVINTRRPETAVAFIDYLFNN